MHLARAFPILVALAAIAARAQISTPAPDLASTPAPAPAVAINPALPSLFIASDSTAARGKGETQQGWGVPFANYFDPAKINIVNRARAGRSSRTFITEGLWAALLADVKKDDIVLIQFGHNDGSPVNEDSSVPPQARRARGSLPGLGEETRDIDNILTKKHEVVHTFGWYLRKMIAEVKAKDAKPIIVSLTARNLWTAGRIERGAGRFSPWAYEVAKAAGVPFVDLTTTMADHFDALGAAKTAPFYPQDHTHFNAAGAELHAAAVLASLKGWRPNPVEKFLSAKGETVPADKAAWLRLPTAANPQLPSLFLAGDSTVRNHDGSGSLGGQWGWGDFLAPHFDLEKINVINRAVGGTGARTFRAPGGYWDRLLAQLRPGDFVLIQFGHNDNGARGALKGVGEETEERPATPAVTGEHPADARPAETVHTFGWYLRQDLADVRAKGATPIVCSLVPRKTWKDGKISRSKDTHAGWAEQVAVSEHAPFLDLNELIAQRYDSLGEEKVNALFADEHTHTTAAGAELNATIVASALRALPENPLAPFLRAAR